MRRQRREKTRGRRVGRLLLSILALVGLTGVGIGAGYLGAKVRRALQTGELFDIREIAVEGVSLISRDEVLAYSGLLVGDGLYSFDAGRVERSVSDHPMVARARLVRRPPHRLRVLVVEQRPVAYIAMGALYAVDAQGEIFARAEALGGLALPVVTGLERAAVAGGEQQRVPRLREALQVMSACRRVGLDLDELAEVHVDSALGINLELTAEPSSVHLGRGGFVDKLERLVRLRQALAARGERASHVFLGDGPDKRRVVVRRIGGAQAPREQKAETAVEPATPAT